MLRMAGIGFTFRVAGGGGLCRLGCVGDFTMALKGKKVAAAGMLESE